MKTLTVSTEIVLALFVAAVLAGAAMADVGDDLTRVPDGTAAPTANIPGTTGNRTGLPPAPAEKLSPGIGSRPLTGNDTPTPGPTKPDLPEPVK